MLAARWGLGGHWSGEVREGRGGARGAGELSDEASARMGRDEAMREKAGGRHPGDEQGDAPGDQQGDQHGEILARLNGILEKVAPA